MTLQLRVADSKYLGQKISLDLARFGSILRFLDEKFFGTYLSAAIKTWSHSILKPGFHIAFSCRLLFSFAFEYNERQMKTLRKIVRNKKKDLSLLVFEIKPILSRKQETTLKRQTGAKKGNGNAIKNKNRQCCPMIQRQI